MTGMSKAGLLEESERKLAETTALLRQREREFAELHHRISNSLALVSSFLTLQRRRLRDPAAIAALTDAIERIQGVARVKRALRKQSAETEVDFGKFLVSLGPELSLSTGLQCRVAAESVALESGKAMSLAVALNELVTNAGKHGYRGTRGGVVDVTLRYDADRDLLLTVSDHGRGLSKGFKPEEAKGLGLSYVVAIAEQFGGRLEVANQNGAQFTIRLPGAAISRSPSSPEAQGSSPLGASSKAG